MTDYYVDSAATGTGDGLSPVNAFTTLNTSIPGYGDVIWVRRSSVFTANGMQFGTAGIPAPVDYVTNIVGWPKSGDVWYSSRPAAGISAGWDADGADRFEIAPAALGSGAWAFGFWGDRLYLSRCYINLGPLSATTGHTVIAPNAFGEALEYTHLVFDNCVFRMSRGRCQHPYVSEGYVDYHNCLIDWSDQTSPAQTTPLNEGSDSRIPYTKPRAWGTEMRHMRAPPVSFPASFFGCRFTDSMNYTEWWTYSPISWTPDELEADSSSNPVTGNDQMQCVACFFQDDGLAQRNPENQTEWTDRDGLTQAAWTKANAWGALGNEPKYTALAALNDATSDSFAYVDKGARLIKVDSSYSRPASTTNLYVDVINNVFMWADCDRTEGANSSTMVTTRLLTGLGSNTYPRNLDDCWAFDCEAGTPVTVSLWMMMTGVDTATYGGAFPSKWDLGLVVWYPETSSKYGQVRSTQVITSNSTWTEFTCSFTPQQTGQAVAYVFRPPASSYPLRTHATRTTARPDWHVVIDPQLELA